MTSELKPLTFADELRAAVRGGLKTHYEELMLQAAELIGEKKSSVTPSADPLAGLVRYDEFEIARAHEAGEIPDGGDTGLYVLHSEAAKVIAEKDAEIDQMVGVASDQVSRAEAAEAQLSQIKAILKNPDAVHVSLLRGDIAKPTTAQINHVYAAPVSDSLKAECDRYKKALEFYGDKANWDSGDFQHSVDEHLGHNVLTLNMPHAVNDQGKIARAALNVEASNDKV